MPKAEYHFDPESVSFERQSKPIKKKLFLFFGFIILAALLGFISFWIVFQYIDSPKERLLKIENQTIKTEYEVMAKKIKNLDAVLQDLGNRDDNLYRFLLNADPIPSELRNAGMGGINKYTSSGNGATQEIVTETKKALDKLVKKAYVQSKSLDELEELANQHQTMLRSVPAIMPIRKELLRSRPSGYGMRLHPIYGVYKMHTGMDFSVPKGSEIYATGDGVVSKVLKRRSGYGIHVKIKHNYGGYMTLYAHMTRAKVRVGQRVKRGEIIGYVGSTGTSTAPHVHYEVRKNDKIMNPLYFYFNDLTPEQYEQIVHDSNNSVQSFD